MSTSTEDQTTQDTAEYVSNKGTEFDISRTESGLYFIRMKAGGKKPPLCDELFTRKPQAEYALEMYLKQGDRTGYAKYPSKERDAKSEDN